MEPNNTERICITWLECSSLIRYWTQSFIILKKLRIWDIEPINSVNNSTTSQATNLIFIGHRALKKTYVMVQKGQKSHKVDIEPDNSQPTIFMHRPIIIVPRSLQLEREKHCYSKGVFPSEQNLLRWKKTPVQ